MRYLTILILIVSVCGDIYGQKNVLAGEIDAQQLATNDTIFARVRLYTEIDSTVNNDKVTLFWGDFTVDTVPRSYVVPISEDIQMEVYEAKHYYDFNSWNPNTLFFIHITSVQLSSTITNWNPDVDTLPMGFFGCMFYNVWTPTYNPFPSYTSSSFANSVEVNDTAIVYPIRLSGMEDDSMSVLLSYDILDSNYIYPTTLENIFIQDDSLFIWKHPQQEGRFIFLLGVREHFTYQPNFYRVLMPRMIMIEVDSAFSVQTNQVFIESNLLKYYPNPTSDYLTIDFQQENFEPFNTRLYNISGQLIREINISSDKTEINLRDLPSGMYLLQSNIKGNVYVDKIMKK